MLKLIKTSSAQEVVDYLVDNLNTQLASGAKCLWLVSGGSSTTIAVDVSKLISRDYVRNLTVTQVDERFGPTGHKDSNWQALLAGGFKGQGMRVLPILKDKDIQLTKNDFEETLKIELESAEFKVGLFGIGADGHTAGILPNSPAIESLQLSTAYQGPDFRRITVTAHVFSLLDLAVGYAIGENKKPALLKLEQDLSAREQPAQALKLAKRTVVFNDQIGDNL